MKYHKVFEQGFVGMGRKSGKSLIRLIREESFVLSCPIRERDFLFSDRDPPRNDKPCTEQACGDCSVRSEERRVGKSVLQRV